MLLIYQKFFVFTKLMILWINIYLFRSRNVVWRQYFHSTRNFLKKISPYNTNFKFAVNAYDDFTLKNTHTLCYTHWTNVYEEVCTRIDLRMISVANVFCHIWDPWFILIVNVFWVIDRSYAVWSRYFRKYCMNAKFMELVDCNFCLFA